MTDAQYWAARPLAKCAMRINGTHIEDLVPAFRTLEVSGRHDIEAEIDSYETAQAGSVYVRRREQSRTLRVRFAAKVDTTTALHGALNAVNGILRAEQMEIIFDDEPDKFYKGTRARMVIETLLPTFAGGYIEIFCADPYKYSTMVFEEVADASGVVTISYSGTIPAYPVIRAVAASDVGGFSFSSDDGASITVGDLEQADGETIQMPETLESLDFTASNPDLTNWAQGASTTYPSQYFTLGGSNYVNSTGLHAIHASASNWTGPSYQFAVPADHNGDIGAANFGVSLGVDFGCRSATGYDRGGLIAVFNAGNDTDGYEPVFIVEIYKSGYPSTRADIRLEDASGNILQRSIVNVGVDDNALEDATLSISKIGSTLGVYSPGGMLRVDVPALEAVEVAQVEIILAKYANLYSVKNDVKSFSMIKYAVNNWHDMPNVFTAGDEVAVDCGSCGITVDGVARPDLGDIDNDFEGMALIPGLNSIQCAANSWVTDTPAYSVKYREVFL